MTYSNFLAHHGIKGQKWGVRRFRNTDGTLTDEGKARYGKTDPQKDKTKFIRGRVSKLDSTYTDINKRWDDEARGIYRKYRKQYSKLEKQAYAHTNPEDYEKYWKPLEDLEGKIDKETDEAFYKYGVERKQATINFLDEMKSTYGNFTVDDLDINSGVLGKPSTYGNDADHPGSTYSDYDYMPITIQNYLYDSNTGTYDNRYWNFLGAKDEQDYYKKMGW